MNEMKRIMAMKPDTILVDKYGGAEFTVKEVTALAVPMIRTDTQEDIDRFCERFEVKEKGV